jgi:transcriptional regulator with XRE-family HTH domain
MVHIPRGERILGFERGVNETNPRMILALAEALTVEPMQLLFLPNGVDLEALRIASGLSAAEMARSAHVSLRSYLRWESGHNLPLDNERILSALALRLGISSAQIMNALHRCAVASTAEFGLGQVSRDIHDAVLPRSGRLSAHPSDRFWPPCVRGRIEASWLAGSFQ